MGVQSAELLLCATLVKLSSGYGRIAAISHPFAEYLRQTKFAHNIGGYSCVGTQPCLAEQDPRNGGMCHIPPTHARTYRRHTHNTTTAHHAYTVTYPQPYNLSRVVHADTIPLGGGLHKVLNSLDTNCSGILTPMEPPNGQTQRH